MDEFEVHGIDVSHHQAQIHWDTIANQAISFAFVKATEGATHIDTMYCHNWQEMGRIGLKRGAYHFFRTQTSPVTQAQNFINWVQMDNGDLPPVLDIEVKGDISKRALVDAVRTWLIIVETRYNIKPILYTNIKFYNRYLAGHFNDYPVWIARYNTREPRLACGRDWDFWQYGNKGLLDGIEGHVDFNVFKGNLLELESFCKAPVQMYSFRE
ncbi:MAG: GH25 family lysozyme [Saprospiraceae bacterium]